MALCRNFTIEIKKKNRCRSRSPDNAKFGPYTLLFCRGLNEIYKDSARAQPLFCSFNLLFGDVVFVVFLTS